MGQSYPPETMEHVDGLFKGLPFVRRVMEKRSPSAATAAFFILRSASRNDLSKRLVLPPVLPFQYPQCAQMGAVLRQKLLEQSVIACHIWLVFQLQQEFNIV